MAKILAQSGHSLDLPLRRVTLGESSACDIPLATGLGLSPRHFEIEATAGGAFIVRDLSTAQGGSGTFVNNQQVTEHLLQHGNVISAGSLQLGFWIILPQEEAPSPFFAGPRSAPSAPVPPDPVAAEPAPVMFIPAPVPAPAPAAPPVQPGPPATAPAVPPAPVMEPAALQAPPPAPVPQPPAAPFHSEGPPVAWINPAETPAPAAAPAAAPAGTTVESQAPAPAKPRRIRAGGRRFMSPRAVALASVVLVAGLGAAAYQLDPVKKATAPLVAKFTAWSNPPPPPPKAAPGTPGAAKPAAGKEAAPEIPADVLPRAEHNEVVKQMLTERTMSLFQADLKQLVPFYNANAAARNLPPLREMTEAFRKYYGVLLDGFERLTCLQARGKDGFVFILTSSQRINLEALIGVASPRQKPSPGKRSANIYSVKTTGRVFGVAQYDPFTILLGNSSWIETALGASSGTALREALCMFPDAAIKNPGALIMVDRLNNHAPGSAPIAFQTAISNLFFSDTGKSSLTLTRNPEVKEEVFVEQSSAALKAQAETLMQSVKIGRQLSSAAKQTPSASEAPVDTGAIITTADATITIPDGDAMLREAIDSVARTFMSQSPSVELILAAQRAVFSFNMARLQKAPEAQSVNGVTEALELLQNGIVVRGRPGGSDLTYKIDRLEPAQADEIVHLLAIEDRTGLVFRPNTDELSGAMLELAVKARDYRNAELLISLWEAAKFGPNDATDANIAARRILDWANKEGMRQRISVGLPALTAAEYSSAVSLLSFENGRLSWRPGEEGYRKWLRRINPAPKADAKKIAGIYGKAQKADAIPGGKVRELADSVKLISSGVKAGSGSGSGRMLYHTGNLTHHELRAAARHLRFESGALKVVEH